MLSMGRCADARRQENNKIISAGILPYRMNDLLVQVIITQNTKIQYVGIQRGSGCEIKCSENANVCPRAAG